MCDRWFDLIKIHYHQANVYTMDMLHGVCNELDDITFFTMSSNIFCDYYDKLGNFYKPFKSGAIQMNQ